MAEENGNFIRVHFYEGGYEDYQQTQDETVCAIQLPSGAIEKVEKYRSGSLVETILFQYIPAH